MLLYFCLHYIPKNKDFVSQTADIDIRNDLVQFVRTSLTAHFRNIPFQFDPRMRCVWATDDFAHIFDASEMRRIKLTFAQCTTGTFAHIILVAAID